MAERTPPSPRPNPLPNPAAPPTPLTEADVRRIVAEMLGLSGDTGIGTVWFGGNQSAKKIGEGVAAAAMHNSIVVVDLRRVRRISGQKVWWQR